MSSLKLMPSKFSQLPQTFTKPAQKRYFHGQECLATRDEDHHVSKLVMLEGEYITGIFAFNLRTVVYRDFILKSLIFVIIFMFLQIFSDSIESATIKSQNFSEESPHDLEQKCSSKSMAVLDGEILEHDKSKNVTDTAGIKTISSVNMVREWKKSKTAEGKRRGSSGSSRRKRYDTDRV